MLKDSHSSVPERRPAQLGYTGGDYMQHHNPFTYFTDGVNSPSELNNLVPFSQFASDLANNALPSFPTSFPISRTMRTMAR